MAQFLQADATEPTFRPETAWLEHGPFITWLVRKMRPRRFVELGTHWGYSYFAVCETVLGEGFPTRCTAVDTWQGDEHAGLYDETVYETVQRVNAPYAAFSTLLRKTFDAALADIEDGSIDLLHIDGRHFYEDARHDYETWLPKLAADGVVLFHDTEVRERGFGVYRLWAELSRDHPSFNFLHGHGLGVLFRGAEVPAALTEMVALSASAGGPGVIEDYFQLLGGQLTERAGAAHRLAEMEMRLSSTRQDLEAHRAALRDAEALLEQTRQQAETDLLTVRSESEATMAQVRAELETALSDISQDLEAHRGALRDAEALLEQTRQQAETDLLTVRSESEATMAQVRAELETALVDAVQAARKIATRAARAERHPVGTLGRRMGYGLAKGLLKLPGTGGQIGAPLRKIVVKHSPKRYFTLVPTLPEKVPGAAAVSRPTLAAAKASKRRKLSLSRRAEVAVLRSASRLTAFISPRHSQKFDRSAQKREGRVGEKDAAELAPDQPALHASAQIHTLRSGRLSAEADVLVLVLFSSDGHLTDLHRYQIARYADAGYTLILFVNTPLVMPATVLLRDDPALDSVASAFVRENTGFDFGAWGDALKMVGGLGRQRTLSFTNDSVLPLDVDAMCRVRDSVAAAKGAVFLTLNTEVRPHAQSYFFGFREPPADALALLSDLAPYEDKDRLIQEVELHFSDRLRARGVEIETLFHVADAEAQTKNPTIHFWRALIAEGFPFLKLQLFSAGFLDPGDPETRELLGPEGVHMLQAHLHARSVSAPLPVLDINQPPCPALPMETRHSEIGALQAYNPPAATRPALVLPLDDTQDVPCSPRQVLVVLHAFYPDMAEDLVKRLRALEGAETGASFRIVLTTDTEAKAEMLRSGSAERSALGHAQSIVVGPNRGRDVAPFLQACAAHLEEADDLVLHLHTKKSPHDGNLAGWGAYLFDCLLGSPALVRSTMQLFDEPSLGMVYPGPFRALDGLRNWGFDFPHAQSIMRRLGHDLSADEVLDFPTGTMFWARPAALRPLVNLGLAPEDFEPEAGQVDGTLAHAVERTLVHAVEFAGYKAQPVVAEHLQDQNRGFGIPMSVQHAKAFIGRIQANLRGYARPRSGFTKDINEIYEVGTGRSDSDRPRLNVLVPTVQPEKIFGGVSTALRVADRLWKAHGDIDLRVLVTSDDTDAMGVDEVSRRLWCNMSLSMPEDDPKGASLVSLRSQSFRPLSLRRNDYFLSTAWWTTDLGFRLHDAQIDLFGAAPKLVYLIQDYEPGFYNWSNRYVLAQNTYARPKDTIALVNSEELAQFLYTRHAFPDAYCVPFSLEPRLAEKLVATRKEPIILVYGRPSVDRNAFSIIVEGLRRWQLFAPAKSRSWRIVVAGEDFDPTLLRELENASVVGKLSLDGYADMLNRAAVGVSMMISPHPSYPPLEMASAGVLTLTNGFECKDLSKRAANIASLAVLSPDAIAAGLADLTARADLGAAVAPVDIGALPSPYPVLEYTDVACRQRGAESG